MDRVVGSLREVAEMLFQGFMWLGTGVLLTVAVGRMVAHDGWWPFVILNLFTTTIFLPVYGVIAIAARRRQHALLVVAGFVAACHLFWTVPLLAPPSQPPVEGPTFTLVTANVLYNNPRILELTRELVDLNADVYLLQEFTPPWEAAFREVGMFERYPFSSCDTFPRAASMAIFSRLPLRSVRRISLGGLPHLQGTLEFAGREIDLYNLHPIAPQYPSWVAVNQRGLADIIALVEGIQDRPFIVAGDFNASPHSRFSQRMRSLADDAWDQAGWGFGWTCPNGHYPWLPIRIDRIFLSREFAATSMGVGRGTGSDHRPVIAEIGVRSL